MDYINRETKQQVLVSSVDAILNAVKEDWFIIPDWIKDLYNKEKIKFHPNECIILSLEDKVLRGETLDYIVNDNNNIYFINSEMLQDQYTKIENN